MDNIYFVKELNDLNAEKSTNEYLKKGWKLLHVGMISDVPNDVDQRDYYTSYVVGATKEQFDEEQKELAESGSLDDFLNQQSQEGF